MKTECLSVLLLATLCVAVVPPFHLGGKLGGKSVLNEIPSRPSIYSCGQSPRNPYGKINLQESVIPSVFRELTVREIHGLMHFLYSKTELELTAPEQATIDSNYVYLSELFLPPKKTVLLHLDKGLPKPPREARVVIYRGRQVIPDIYEVVVGPLPNPAYFRPIPFRSKPIPRNFGPPTIHMDRTKGKKIKEYVDRVAGHLLLKLYGSTMTNCGKKCISFGFKTHIASVISGTRINLAWFWMQQFVEFNVLHPLDISLLVERRGADFKIHRVYFNGKLFDSLPETVHYFYQNMYNCTVKPFPIENNNLFSTLHRRGTPPLQVPLKNPEQVSPDGKRYNVFDRHVNYMFWEFDVNMGTVNGPQLFDIRFKKERIAYEISVQEIVALYSGAKPFEQLDLFDSHILLGTLANYLVPGVDCPKDATFLHASFLLEDSHKPVQNKNAICIFEFNTGLPLRRHHGYSKDIGGFYEGMETTVLVVRSILTITNYDYFLDFMFYANGAIEVKAIATGYITSSFYRPNEQQYGFQLHDNIIGLLHHHMFHYKVDLDIKGTRNRYKTLEIHQDVVPNFSKVKHMHQDKLFQNKIVHKMHATERDASNQANTNTPKYLLITNDFAQDKYGNAAGYRIINRRPTTFVRPFGVRKEAALSWARYKVAVTKQKDWEQRSSSMYAYADDENPVVNFHDFVNDDEWIVDEDLVAWVTVGVQHIPHTEDLPVTHTPGMDSSFLLTPYNYFREDPSMASPNAVRINLQRDRFISIQRYGLTPGVNCSPAPDLLEHIIMRDNCAIFACS